MVNKWDYAKQGTMSYGHKESYRRAAAWFDELGGTVEDWGCGHAVFRNYLRKCAYFGIDGSHTHEADLTGVDLCDYRSIRADHILLRHVLDHNIEWRRILGNAILSFKKRALLIFFHDWQPVTKVITVNDVLWARGVPDLVFSREDVMEMVAPFFVKEERIPADTETVNNNVLVYLQKDKSGSK